MSDKPDPTIIMNEPDSKHNLETTWLPPKLDILDLPIIVEEHPKLPADPIVIMIEPSDTERTRLLKVARLLSQLENHDLPIIVADRPKQLVIGHNTIQHAIASALTLTLVPHRFGLLNDFNFSSEYKRDRFYTPNYSEKFQSMASYKASRQSHHIYPIFQPHCAKQARAVRNHKDTLRGRNISPDN